MALKIFKIIAILLLGILPYSTILSGFSPYWTTTYTFHDYLIASLLFAMISLLLGWLIASGKLITNNGFLLFLLGLLTAPPFMIGPPEETPKLLERTTEEHFRYGLLLLSTIAFAIGFIIILRKHWKQFSLLNKLIALPFIFCFVALFWDNLTSYNFSNELKEWMNIGKDPYAFFPNYNFHTFWRTLGRSLIYLLTSWLALILLKEGILKKGQMLFLIIFSSIGIVFFFLTNFIGMQFYFPFMVPAVSLAPAYWLGLMLITKRKPQIESESKV